MAGPIAVTVTATAATVEVSPNGHVVLGLIHPCGCCATANELELSQVDQLIALLTFTRNEVALRQSQATHVMPPVSRA